MFPTREEDHPDWHSTTAHSCDETVKLHEGLRQVKLLTNTSVKEGLPSGVLERAEELASPDQHHFMQRLTDC